MSYNIYGVANTPPSSKNHIVILIENTVTLFIFNLHTSGSWEQSLIWLGKAIMKSFSVK